jgi:hypothetical protein
MFGWFRRKKGIKGAAVGTAAVSESTSDFVNHASSFDPGSDSGASDSHDSTPCDTDAGYDSGGACDGGGGDSGGGGAGGDF